jgi:hypothetical protein
VVTAPRGLGANWNGAAATKSPEFEAAEPAPSWVRQNDLVGTARDCLTRDGVDDFSVWRCEHFELDAGLVPDGV